MNIYIEVLNKIWWDNNNMTLTHYKCVKGIATRYLRVKNFLRLVSSVVELVSILLNVNSIGTGLWFGIITYLRSVLTVAATSGVDLSPFQLEVLKQAHVVYLTRAARKGHNSWKQKMTGILITYAFKRDKLFHLSYITEWICAKYTTIKIIIRF